jgi:hypothetical protein
MWIVTALAAAFHTVLLVLVFIYLIGVHRRLSELRNVRSEAQAWLQEFGRVLSAGITTTADLKKSVAVAQNDLKDLLARADQLRSGGAASTIRLSGTGSATPTEARPAVRPAASGVRPSVDVRIEDEPAEPRRTRVATGLRETSTPDHPLAGLR